MMCQNYNTDDPWRMSRHLLRHEQTAFLPEAYFYSEKFQQLPAREQILSESRENGRRACFEFARAIIDMEQFNINFRPIKFQIADQIEISTNSSFYRSLALFRNCLAKNILAFEKISRGAALIYSRILEIGNSKTEIVDFVPRSNPFTLPLNSHKNLQTIETIEVLPEEDSEEEF